MQAVLIPRLAPRSRVGLASWSRLIGSTGNKSLGQPASLISAQLLLLINA
jgi:hypothetical protein